MALTLEKRGRLVFLYNGNTLRNEVMGKLFLMCHTHDLKIFSLAATEDAPNVLGHEIAYSHSIASLFPNTKSEGHVHFRVEVTTLVQSTVSPSLTSLVTLPKERFPLPPFAEHRHQLNAVLAKKAALKDSLSNGKRKRGESEGYGVASSSIEWGEVENIYEPRMREDKAAFPVKELDDNFIATLGVYQMENGNAVRVKGMESPVAPNIYEPRMREDKTAFPVKELDDNFIATLVAMLQDER
ncbi:hypothetical protein PHMEG_000770 [Phytophthora megakarya]|uniref:Uncharacterized protein n=1 Tax=Phytophthora megakarya TaxID=4795 RepID=A0A225X282_9STRA|nr:hypothetical protein PHMEG_000770 [Phytophthora megakarya]